MDESRYSMHDTWSARRPAGDPVRSAAVVVAVLVVVALGITGVVLGEADDSPGLQGLGVLLAVGAVVLGTRALRRARER
jgi:VIT1/CCC1 family predicted Fe2+/Mn2+ transporter